MMVVELVNWLRLHGCF